MKVMFPIVKWWHAFQIVGWAVYPLVETFETVIRMYIKPQFVIENSQNEFKIQ